MARFQHFLSLGMVLSFAAPAAYAAPTSSECIESMCGNRSAVQHPFDKSPKKKEETQAMMALSMRDVVGRYIGQKIQQGLLADSLRQKVFSRTDLPELDAKNKAFVQSVQYLARMSLYLPALEAGDDGELKFNREKLKAAAPALTDLELDAIQTLAPVLKASMQSLGSLTLDEVAKIMFKGLSKRQAQMQLVTMYRQLRSAVETALPVYKAMNTESLIMKKAARGQTLSREEEKVFLNEISAVSPLLAISNPTVQDAFAKLTVTTKDLVAAAKSKYQNSELAKFVASRESMKPLYSMTQTMCTTSLAYAYAALPDRTQLDTFKNAVDEVQFVAQSMMEERLHSPLPGEFRIDVIYPLDRDTALGQWRQNFQSATQDLIASNREMKSLKLDSAAELQTALVGILATTSASTPLVDVLTYCSQAQPPTLNDHAMPGYNTLTLSWATIVNPEVGITIAAHEIGHLVSGKFSEAIASEKTCLKTKKAASYSEEDFADLFATEVQLRSGGKISGVAIRNFGCALAQRKDNKWEDDSFVKATDGLHSSTIYRLLAVGSLTKTVTPACTEFAKSENVTAFDHYCAWGK